MQEDLQEGSKTFSAVQTNTERERLQHFIERLDAAGAAASVRVQVWSWSALSAAHCADHARCKPQGCEMEQEGAAHYNSNLPRNPDSGVLHATTFYCDIRLRGKV